MLPIKRFAPKWCDWIQLVVEKGNIAVKLNDDISYFFQTKKEVRQGDPLSAMLFNLVVDILPLLIDPAKLDG